MPDLSPPSAPQTSPLLSSSSFTVTRFPFVLFPFPAGCKAIKGTNLYVSLPACDIDNNSNGPAPCFSTSNTCSSCIDSDNFGFGNCMVPNQFGNQISYVSSCSVEPCCSSTGWVVSLAVIFSLATVGLCVFWRIRDLRALARAKAAAAEHEASVAEETAKANSVTGITLSHGGGAGGVHGGYNAL